MGTKEEKKLRDLKNVGKATLADLTLLEISSVGELARQDATFLFQELASINSLNRDLTAELAVKHKSTLTAVQNEDDKLTARNREIELEGHRQSQLSLLAQPQLGNV